MSGRPRTCFVVEGFTDIRFVAGLAGIAELTLLVPEGPYRESGLDRRIAASGARLEVVAIRGTRAAFYPKALVWLLRHGRRFDVLLALEALRGALVTNIAGLLRGVPVVTYQGTDPVATFRTRRERGHSGAGRAWLGEAVIRALLAANGALAARSLVVGRHLMDVVRPYARRPQVGLMYGVDTDYFTPVSADEKRRLRRELGLPADRFVIFFSSRVSHEKDPEAALHGTARARAAGLDAVLMNLSGGHEAFLALAHELGYADAQDWVLARPAAHPMTELAAYYQASDAMVQASLAEGCGYSPLESLACGVPAIVTAVGGLAVHLPGHARMVGRRDADGIARELLAVAADPAAARADALRAREHVVAEWSRRKAFADLDLVLREVAAGARRAGAARPQPQRA